MMTLNTGSYVCPVSADLPFYDSQCATYIDTGSNTYECIACKTTYSLKVMSISNINYKRCLKNLFTDCTIYSSDGVCSKCLNGVSFNTYFNICPSQAFKLVSNCQAAVLGSTTVSCIACKTDYIVSPTSGCFTQIQYCEIYTDSGKCKKCVFGYALMNNVCYKVQGNCGMFDPKTSTCNKCATGFTLKNNECIAPLIPCLENQYRNSDGICVNGNTINCGFYNSANGICQYCKDGYKFDDFWNCIKINSVVCPPNTVDYSYIIELGVCKKIDNNCAYSGVDGCLACKDGYYLINKQCQITTYQGLTTQTSQNTQTFKESDYWF